MGSTIDETKPVDGIPAVKADLRSSLQSAKAEIQGLQVRWFPVRGPVGVNTVVFTQRFDTPFEVIQAEGSAAANSFEYTVDIDGTPVTGLSGNSISSPTIGAPALASSNNTGVAGQRVSISLANAQTATDFYIAVQVEQSA